MYKIDIPVTRCIPGMITAEPIIDLNTGTIIVAAEQILTDHTISNLYHFNYDKICVYVTSWNNVWNVSPELIEKYEKHRQSLKQILDHITLGNLLDVDSVKNIAENIQVDFNANYTILACINMVRLADEYTYTHSINVALLAMLIGKWMQYDEETINQLVLAGLVHDVGKAKIPPEILHKPSKLNEIEFEVMKKHVIYGYEILEEVRKLHSDIIEGVLVHHEKMDGTGYPQGIKGEYINKLGKVLAVADIYDAMTSHRIYKEKQSPFDVMELMQNGVFGKLDTEILLTFVTNMANYYIGVYVVLNTGEVGEVVFIHPHCVYRPIVRVGEKYIDLYVQKHVKIIQIA
ncbi:MAG: HD-GYP domain-containing protein [Cellulosilyticaceae bacterium]